MSACTAVGHPQLCWRGRAMAAVLAVGGDASVDLRAAARFHESARASWRMRRNRPIDIVTTRQVRITDRGIRVHRTRILPDADRVIIDGVPVVSAERLLVDMSQREAPTVLCKLIDERAYHERFDADATRACMARLRNGRTGSFARLTDVLALYEDGDHGTDSELEERAREWTESLLVPTPGNNVYVTVEGERMRLDQVWELLGVAVEVDCIGHGRPTRRRADQRRRAKLRREGWCLVVMTRERLMDPVQRAYWGHVLERAIQSRLAARARGELRASADA